MYVGGGYACAGVNLNRTEDGILEKADRGTYLTEMGRKNRQKNKKRTKKEEHLPN